MKSLPAATAEPPPSGRLADPWRSAGTNGDPPILDVRSTTRKPSEKCVCRHSRFVKGLRAKMHSDPEPAEVEPPAGDRAGQGPLAAWLIPEVRPAGARRLSDSRYRRG